MNTEKLMSEHSEWANGQILAVYERFEDLYPSLSEHNRLELAIKTVQCGLLKEKNEMYSHANVLVYNQPSALEMQAMQFVEISKSILEVSSSLDSIAESIEDLKPE